MNTVPSPRLAIYARYSSDLQNPSSIEDQVLLCRKLVSEKWPDAPEPVVYSDAALSGEAMENRPAMGRLVAAAVTGDIDVIVSEGLDRLSRSLTDVSMLYEQLTYYGVSVVTAHEGEIGPLHIGLKGTMNALYLTDMKDRVRRSHKARAEKGLAPSGLPYGYRVVRGVLDDRGEPVRGLREIDEDEAIIVRRIFGLFVDGMAPKEIAVMLTAEGVMAPGGAVWREGAIRGSSTRGDGILRNEIYRGVLVYNRKRLVTNPMTRRKKYVVNDEKEWVRTKVPHLRIVDDALWKQARRLLAQASMRLREKKRPTVPGTGKLRKPPLKDLIFCGWCGHKNVLKNSFSYTCSSYKNNRACRNARSQKVVTLKTAVFDALATGLADVPALLGDVRTVVAREQATLQASHEKLADIETRLNNLMGVIENGARVSNFMERIRELEKSRRKLRKSLSPSIEPPSSEGEIRETLAAGLDLMEKDFHIRERELDIRAGLALVVRGVVLTPIEGQRTGESIDITLRPEGWAALWLLIRSWPDPSSPDFPDT